MIFSDKPKRLSENYRDFKCSHKIMLSLTLPKMDSQSIKLIWIRKQPNFTVLYPTLDPIAVVAQKLRPGKYLFGKLTAPGFFNLSYYSEFNTTN